MKPLLVTQVYNDRVAGAVKLALLERYPRRPPGTASSWPRACRAKSR